MPSVFRGRSPQIADCNSLEFLNFSQWKRFHWCHFWPETVLTCSRNSRRPASYPSSNQASSWIPSFYKFWQGTNVYELVVSCFPVWITENINMLAGLSTFYAPLIYGQPIEKAWLDDQSAQHSKKQPSTKLPLQIVLPWSRENQRNKNRYFRYQ